MRGTKNPALIAEMQKFAETYQGNVVNSFEELNAYSAEKLELDGRSFGMRRRFTDDDLCAFYILIREWMQGNSTIPPFVIGLAMGVKSASLSHLAHSCDPGSNRYSGVRKRWEKMGESAFYESYRNNSKVLTSVRNAIAAADHHIPFAKVQLRHGAYLGAWSFEWSSRTETVLVLALAHRGKVYAFGWAMAAEPNSIYLDERAGERFPFKTARAAFDAAKYVLQPNRTRKLDDPEQGSIRSVIVDKAPQP